MDRRTALLTLGGLGAAATLLCTGEATAAPLGGFEQPRPANIVTDDLTAVLEPVDGNDVTSGFKIGTLGGSRLLVERARYADEAFYTVRSNRHPGDSITKHRYGVAVDVEFFDVTGPHHLDEAVIATMESSILCGEELLEARSAAADVVVNLTKLLGHLPHFLVLHPSDADRVLREIGGMRCIVSRFAVPGFCFGTLAPARVGGLFRRDGMAAVYLRESTVARVILDP